jgi:hypothetical protein
MAPGYIHQNMDPHRFPGGGAGSGPLQNTGPLLFLNGQIRLERLERRPLLGGGSPEHGPGHCWVVFQVAMNSLVGIRVCDNNVKLQVDTQRAGSVQLMTGATADHLDG